MKKKFYIKKFSYSGTFSQETLKELPMLIRRKLSDLDKIALTNILSIHETFENIVFSSQYGEFERLFKLIEQHSTENEVSPIQFSSSVHNSLTGTFCLAKNKTIPYYALSSGNQSLSNGLLYSIISNKKTLFCYADTYKYNKSVACVVSNNASEGIEIEFNPKIKTKTNDEYSDFIKFLNNETKEFKTEMGVFTRYD